VGGKQQKRREKRVESASTDYLFSPRTIISGERKKEIKLFDNFELV